MKTSTGVGDRAHHGPDAGKVGRAVEGKVGYLCCKEMSSLHHPLLSPLLGYGTKLPTIIPCDPAPSPPLQEQQD